MLTEIKVPMLAESVSEATLMNWHKQPGDAVKRGDNLIDIETDKVTLEITAPQDGVLQEIIKDNGADVSSNEIIALLAPVSAEQLLNPVENQPSKEAASLTVPILDPSQAVDESNLVDLESPPKLNPAARQIISEHQLDVANIDHHADRITKQDVVTHLDTTVNQLSSVDPEPLPPVINEIPEPLVQEQSDHEGERREPMSRLRQRIAERLLQAQQENAILTTFNEVNMQPVMDLRKRYRDEFEQAHGVRLGFMSFFCKAALEALKRYPVVNASVDGQDIVYHDYYDMGIAVSSPKGLFVPVLRDVENKTLAQIEMAIRDYGERAQTGSLGIEELTGGTFTITNGGVFGSLLSTPILNPPQSGILGMHKIQERPIAENGNVVIRPMMYLALSYDHRIIDGREAVQFLVAIKEQLEDPARLLLQI